MYDDIQEERKSRNQEPLAKTTFHRGINQKILSMFFSETDNWFKAKKITFPENYSLETNRESLKTIFTFSDLKHMEVRYRSYSSKIDQSQTIFFYI